MMAGVGRCWSLCVLVLCVVVCLFGSLPSVHISAQGYSKPENTSLVPVCFVQVSFNKVSKVDGVEQLFDADFYMQLFWLDLKIQDWLLSPNNTSPNNQNGTGPFTAIAQGNFEFSPRMNLMYDPMVEFVNGDGDIVSTGTYYTITTPPFVTDEMLKDLGITIHRDDLRWSVKDFRYIGSFTTPLDLHSFPYDRQYVQLVIESIWADSTQLTLVYTNNTKAQLELAKPSGKTNQIIGWEIEEVRVIRTWHMYNLYPGGNYSRLVVAMAMSRQPEYYVGKIVVGVVLLVLMCVCVYSLSVDEADRQMGTLTVFSGIVTFLFVASADVPKIPYLTRLDMFFLCSFGFTAFMLVSHAISYFWRSDEGAEDEESTHEEHAMGKDWLPEKSNITHNSTIKLHVTSTSQDITTSPDTTSTSLRNRKSTQQPTTTPLASEGQILSGDLEMQSLSSSPTNTDIEQKQSHDTTNNNSNIINVQSSSYDMRKPSSTQTNISSPVPPLNRMSSPLRRAWHRSSCWRKTDSMFVIVLFIAYAIACAIILGAVNSTISLAYDDQVLSDWPDKQQQYEWWKEVTDN